MPQCILSCFSTSVLYANRTPATTVAVIRSLQQGVAELLKFETIMATPTEKLAVTQALFLYQVIRLFDGDIALRVQAEKDMALLEAWLGDLCKIRENLGGLSEVEDGGARDSPPKEWEVCPCSPVAVLRIVHLLVQCPTEMDICRVGTKNNSDSIFRDHTLWNDEGYLYDR